MDIRQLTTFHKVATVMSFTRAAAELSYAQSSVTAQVKGLEASLGVQLFERLGGKIQLTHAGRRLLPYAEQLLSLADEARGAAVGSGDPDGMLTIGSTESIASYRMPPLLEYFHHRYPRLQVSLRQSHYAETCYGLRQGMYDMGFLMEADTQHHGVQAEILGVEPLVLISSPDHAMAGLRTVGTDDLRQVQLLSPEAGCAYRELFEAELKSSAGGPVSFIEFGTIEAIKRGVATGLGVSLLPTVTVADAIAAGTLVALPWEPPFEVYTQLAWRKGKRLTREMRLFIDRAIQFLGEDRTPALAS